MFFGPRFWKVTWTCRRPTDVTRGVGYDARTLSDFLADSKVDQEGEGRVIGIPYSSNPASCPVRAYRRWIAASGIGEGLVFRQFYNSKMGTTAITPQVVALVIKKPLRKAGLDAGALAGHHCDQG